MENLENSFIRTKPMKYNIHKVSKTFLNGEIQVANKNSITNSSKPNITMKKSLVSTAMLIAGLLVHSVFVTGCGNKAEQQQEQTEGDDHHHAEGDTTHHDEMQQDSTKMAYACPMHQEVTGKEGDTCSKCGMKLEPVKDSEKRPR